MFAAPNHCDDYHLKTHGFSLWPDFSPRYRLYDVEKSNKILAGLSPCFSTPERQFDMTIPSLHLKLCISLLLQTKGPFTQISDPMETLKYLCSFTSHLHQANIFTGHHFTLAGWTHTNTWKSNFVYVMSCVYCFILKSWLAFLLSVSPLCVHFASLGLCFVCVFRIVLSQVFLIYFLSCIVTPRNWC